LSKFSLKGQIFFSIFFANVGIRQSDHHNFDHTKT